MLTMGREADQRYWMYDRSEYWPWIKKHILIAPLFGVRHNREIQLSQAVSIGTLPSRLHTAILFFWILSNIAYCLALDWTKIDFSVIAEMRGRTGVLAALNLIPTILFALRNNPLIPLLGVSYDTFNLLHRWTARIMVFEAIIHTIMWATNNISEGGADQLRLSLATSTSYAWGMVATCAFITITIFSVGPVRHAFYETFLNTHRILAYVGVAGVFVHLDAAGLPQLPWMWVIIVLYTYEICWRLGRVVYHNYSRKKGLTKVTVEWLPSEACRVTFELSTPWRWKPGCHVHAYLPAVAWYHPWSSHPFSIAWAENRPSHAPMEIEMEKLSPVESPNTGTARPSSLAYSRTGGKGGTLQALASVNETTSKSEDTGITLPRDNDVTSISLIMRARTGMTRKLYEKMVKRDRKPWVTRGAIEGPYGGHESLSSYGTVILFAGGVGITHCVGYIRHLMLQYQMGTCSARKILLVWSVPNTEALEWVRVWMDQILKMEGRREILRVQLFVTKPRHRGEVVSSTGSVQMFPGRCKPETIIDREMPERIGTVGVTVCGPGAFSDSVRAACRAHVDKGALDFVEEAFTY